MEKDPLIPGPESFHPVYSKSVETVQNMMYEGARTIFLAGIKKPLLAEFMYPQHVTPETISFEKVILRVTKVRHEIPDSNYTEYWLMARDEYGRHICSEVMATIRERNDHKFTNNGGLL